MADFQTSTHREKWIFSSEDLAKKCRDTNQRALRMIEKGVIRVDVEMNGEQKSVVEKHGRCKALSMDEERLLRVFYEAKIQEVCAAFGFPHKIQGTALIYFKRFYLHWSVMEHHPKSIMLTCIYAACKIEESHVAAEELGKGIEQDHEVILNNELVVYQSLGFDLIVYAPYRALEGFIVDMADFLEQQFGGGGAADMLHSLRETGIAEVDKSMLTDAPLLFPPGQLALAALGRANEVHRSIDFGRYLSTVATRSTDIALFIHALHAIDNLVMGIRVPAAEDMKHIDRKLKSCHTGSHDSCTSKKRERKSKEKLRKADSRTPVTP